MFLFSLVQLISFSRARGLKFAKILKIIHFYEIFFYIFNIYFLKRNSYSTFIFEHKNIVFHYDVNKLTASGRAMTAML